MLGIHVGFLLSIQRFENDNQLDYLFETFLEFVVLYYPLAKVRKLIKVLIEQNPNRRDFLVFQRQALESRETTTKKHILSWTKRSQVLKYLFEESLEILGDIKSANPLVATYLQETTNEFLS